MDSIPCLHSNARSWLLESDLAPHIGVYVDYLKLGQYANTTIKTYVACIAHFARWKDQCHLELECIDEETVGRFLGEHLPHCDCPPPVCRRLEDLRPACRHLVRVLRNNAVIAEPKPQAAPDDIEEELRGFDAYMGRARGLASKTRRDRIRIVRWLLQGRFAEQPFEFSALRPDEVRQFIAGQLKHPGKKSRTRALASALRAYFRYRAGCGDHTDALASVIASPAEWSLGSLPQSLSDEEVNRLLESFTPALPSYRRGYAMVRCALDMGLRSGEIAKLTLNDIDWQVGTLTLRCTKSRREDVLPLPAVTGQALVDYLRFERPRSDSSAVFVRHLAPRGAPIGPDAVRRVIRDAYRRIGLTHGRSHALRHTVARRLLAQGSSLKEVADVLRHRSLNTTLIYAKLDSRRLLAVALPWPGSTS